MHIFTYGTLMDAHPRRMLRMLADCGGVGIWNLGPARTPGVLYDLGAFPGLGHGDGVVTGELFEIPESLLARVDRFEGVPHHYTREEVFVMTNDGNDTPTAKAWAYFIVETPPPSKRVPSGDWLQHLKGKQP